MSDRMDFYEIRQGEYPNYKHVAFSKDEESAEKVMSCIQKQNPDTEYSIEHVEIIADIDMRFGEY